MRGLSTRARRFADYSMDGSRGYFILVSKPFEYNSNALGDHDAFVIGTTININNKTSYAFFIIYISEFEPNQFSSLREILDLPHNHDRDLRPRLPLALHASFPETNATAALCSILSQTQKAVISRLILYAAPSNALGRPAIEMYAMRLSRDAPTKCCSEHGQLFSGLTAQPPYHTGT